MNNEVRFLVFSKLYINVEEKRTQISFREK